LFHVLYLSFISEILLSYFSAWRIGHRFRATGAPRPGKTEGPGRRISLSFSCPLSVKPRVNDPLRQGASRSLRAIEVARIGPYRQQGKNCSYDPNILKYVAVIIDQN
jgi:hypothetical protein